MSEVLKHPVDRCADDVVLLDLSDVQELAQRALYISEFPEFPVRQPERLARLCLVREIKPAV